MKINSNDLMSDDQSELRAKLLATMRKHPASMTALAKDIGIAAMTLIDFVKGKRKINFPQLCKIENWIEKKGASNE